MEATDGTAGNADEHDGEDGQCNRIGMRVLQSVHISGNAGWLT